MKHKEAVANLHESGILPEVIAMQLDLSVEEVMHIINDAKSQDKEKSSVQATKQAEVASASVFYLDAVVNIDSIIRSAQLEMWKSLKGEMEFNISTEDTQNALEKLAGSKATLVILYIDIVSSTKLSMTLPVDKLAAIVRAFTHEMSLVASAYGGYVLKYLGDAILAFFVVADRSNLFIPCSNAVNCARSMIRAVKEGFNPLLNQEGYPELSVRVGIDVGEVVVVQYGWNVQPPAHDNDLSQAIRKPHHDIIGYTISMASKITGIAEPNTSVIGQYVYDALAEEQKDTFRKLSTPEMWGYVSSRTGELYDLYGPAA
jgi:class 3 adenylate cyclase